MHVALRERHRPNQDQGRGRREREWERNSARRPSPVPDRKLDVAHRDDGEREGDGDSNAEQAPPVGPGALWGKPEVDRPVEAVHRVAHPAERSQWPGRERRCHRSRVDDHCHDQDGGEHGVGEEATLVEDLVDEPNVEPGPVADPGGGHTRDGDNTSCRRTRRERPLMEHQGQNAADEDLGGSRVRAVIEAVDRGSTAEHEEHESGGRDGPGGEEPRDEPERPPGTEQHEEEQRHRQVELLLDGEGPEVLERRRCPEDLDVRHAAEDEVPVRDLTQSRHHRAGKGTELLLGGDRPPKTSTPTIVSSAAGASRRYRRIQNGTRSSASRRNDPRRRISEVMRNPDRVKNCETARAAPGIPSCAW